jgi:hypothetical protein
LVVFNHPFEQGASPRTAGQAGDSPHQQGLGRILDIEGGGADVLGEGCPINGLIILTFIKIAAVGQGHARFLIHMDIRGEEARGLAGDMF